MPRFYFLILSFLSLSTVFAQDKPTIYIDIPTQQKPWNHIDWNASPEQFQFAIVTDRTGGHRPGVFPTGIKKLNLLQPEFVMSVGDFIEGYTRDTVRLNQEWKEFNGFISQLEAPFFYIPGNHDITNEVMEEKWEEMFGVSYYHFVYKDVLFLCLNSEDNLRGAGKGTIDDEQYEYIKKVLEENKDVKWTLAFLHQPLWVQDDTKRWNDVEKLLQDRPHNVFAGHYHRYWKTQRNNGKYIALATTGGGSQLRGKAYGEFDHVVWVTMTEEGPILANLFLDGIWDEDVVTEEIVDLVRNRPFPVKIEPVYENNPNAKTSITQVRATNNSDTKMRVQLKGIAHEELFYQFKETDFIVEPNDVTVFDLTIENVHGKVLKDLSTMKVEADITYLFENQPNVEFSSTLNYLPFFKYKTEKISKVKLDGKLKEWDNSQWNMVEDMDGSPFDFDGKEDFEMKFATAYDDTYFYVAVDVKDNDFYTNEKGSYWGQDAIIVGLDARPQLTSAFNAGAGRGRDWLAFLRTFKEENPVYQEDTLPVKVESALKKTETGAQMEMAIPIEYLNKMHEGPWSTLRLDVGYYDFDTADEGSTTHFWVPAWNESSDIPGSGMIFKK
ncbi:sugar-binding protein [Muricauda sp. 334s03]|uniref:Sugar-binding protein n=1 Tax=Flagellimonas yonaguniensis TaxID=3031325 RepID=A0ABT5Y341_9FLAO|nr:sugar-binding protein [[Muricauda] yonaguniensis]MDF0717873.1 sugar-binding protein [[Muricauda] yonaguniensis]